MEKKIKIIDNNQPKKPAIKIKEVKLDDNKNKLAVNQKPVLKKAVSINEKDVFDHEKKKKQSFKDKRNVYEKRDSKLIKQWMTDPNMLNDILEKNYLNQ